MIGYDKLSVNHQILLDLPFREGTGVVTHDIAKPHHILTQQDPGGGSFTWGSLVTGRQYLQFTPVGGGAVDGVYLDCPAADTGDLDFTTEDYSIGGWINWTDTGQSVEVIGRYGINLDGWEVYFYAGIQDYLQLRHNHASFCPSPPCPPGNERTGAYSGGWTPGTWYLMGISRSGASAQMYRNGIAVVTTHSAGGLHDPDACNRDLVIGARFSKDANWYHGMMWGLRVWNRELSADEWLYLFERERHWFGA